MIIAQNTPDRGFDVAEAVTSVPGVIWALVGALAVLLAIRYLLGIARLALALAALGALYALMGAPGFTGSGVSERWNDVKAKAEAFWEAKDVIFDRQG